MVLTLQHRNRASILVVLILFSFLTIPAAAFYFDLQSFETDKLVYEVGESVNMAAVLIADYGTGGWCYISFAVATDQGSVYADEYYISPSPLSRTFNSTYTILPEHTSPGSNGSQALAVFNAEIYDTFQQSDGSTIEFSIIRGHLEVIPLTNLTIPVGSNSTIVLKLASAHNSDVTSNGTNASIVITNSSSAVVYATNTTTDTEGLLHIEWNDTLGSIGTYNLSVCGAESEDFLDFSTSLSLNVVAAPSNLNVVDVPKTVYCQSPNGSHFESANVSIMHTDLHGVPIEGSTITWNTITSSGFLPEIENGLYQGQIPIQSDPGTLLVSIKATHPDFENATMSIPLQVLPNPTNITMDFESINVTQGMTVDLNFTISEYLDWNQPINVMFYDELGEISIESIANPDSASTVSFTAGYNMTPGPHTLRALLTDIHHNQSEVCVFEIVVIGSLQVAVSDIYATYGDILSFNVSATDHINRTVVLFSYQIYLEENLTLIATTPGLVNSTNTQTVSLPLFLSPGNHTLIFRFTSPYYENVVLRMNVTVWMETNMSMIVASAEDTAPLINPLPNTRTNLIGCYHQPPANLVDWDNRCIITYHTRNFSKHLAQIEFGY